MKNLWIKTFKPVPNRRKRLICFPYAGGGALIFRDWHKYLPSDIEVCPVKLPGRENRINEPLFDNMNLLVKTLAKELLPFLDKPFDFLAIAWEHFLLLNLQEDSKSKTCPCLFICLSQAEERLR